jgi:hypothetical protein
MSLPSEIIALEKIRELNTQGLMMKLNQVSKPTPMKGDIISVLVSNTESSMASKDISESYTPLIVETDFSKSLINAGRDLKISSVVPQSLQVFNMQFLNPKPLSNKALLEKHDLC